MTVELARAGSSVPPVARRVVVVVGVAWALVAEGIRIAGGWPIVWVLGDLVPGLAFLACGYVAWTRAPGNRVGPLMIAVGYAWYAGTASASGVPAIDRPAHALQGYYDAFLAWLILAYPTGRLRWRTSHVVVGLFFVVLLARTVFRFLVFPSTLDLEVGDPLAVDRYVALVTIREAGDTVFRVLIAILAVAVLLLAIARWRADTTAGRAIAGPILLGGVGFALGIIVETTTLLGSSDFAERSFAWDVGHWLTVITVSVIPAAFLIGMGQDRLARGRVADLVVGLGGPGPAREDLQTTLAHTLGDPSLIVAYPVVGTDRFIDVTGRAVELPRHEADRAVTRVDRGGRSVAALIHDPALSQRPELMTSVAAATGLALENEQL
jgi:hypothetical protein